MKYIIFLLNYIFLFIKYRIYIDSNKNLYSILMFYINIILKDSNKSPLRFLNDSFVFLINILILPHN